MQKDDVTRFQKTVDNCFEVRKETERCDHINNRKRRKTAEYSEYVFNAAEEKDQVCNNGEDQRDYLVLVRADMVWEIASIQPASRKLPT